MRLARLHDAPFTDGVYGLILVHCVQGLSFTTLFCRNYYVNVPDDLVKAAQITACHGLSTLVATTVAIEFAAS